MDLDEEKLFIHSNFASDLEDDFNKITGGNKRTFSANSANSGSTSATSIVGEYQNGKTSKKYLGADNLRDDMIIDENQLMEFDSVEWDKEINRVSNFLDTLNDKI